jgi:hypothetical protein
VLARGADQRVEVLADRGRPVVVAVARAEPAAEVIDREFAECGDRRHRLHERLEVEDLRADVDVQPLHAQPRAVLDAPDQLRRGGRREPELRPGVTGEHVRVGVGGDARDHPHENVVLAPGRLEPVDVVGVVDDDEADAVLGGHRDLVVALGVAVEDEQRRVGARRQRGDDLAAAGDVEPQPLLDHHPLDRRARERLGGEHHARARPAGGEPVGVLARPRAERRLGDDQQGRVELRCQGVGAAARDGQHPVGIKRAAGREQRQQRVDACGDHLSGGGSAPRRARGCDRRTRSA